MVYGAALLDGDIDRMAMPAPSGWTRLWSAGPGRGGPSIVYLNPVTTSSSTPARARYHGPAGWQHESVAWREAMRSVVLKLFGVYRKTFDHKLPDDAHAAARYSW
jgi:hypothetical protein